MAARRALGAGALGWLLSAGSATFGYLAPVLSGSTWPAGSPARRSRFFATSPGSAPPLGARRRVGLILLGLPFGLLQIWRRHRAEAMAVALGVVVLAYPVTLVLRLTERGAETSNRSSEFLFVGIAFVLAPRRRRALAAPAAVAVAPPGGGGLLGGALATLLFAGGVIVGWGPLARLPGPYLMGTDTRSIEAQGVAGAHTPLRLLGPPGRRPHQPPPAGLARPAAPGLRLRRLGGGGPLFFLRGGPGRAGDPAPGRIRYVVVDRRPGPAPGGGLRRAGRSQHQPPHGPHHARGPGQVRHRAGRGRIYDSGATSWSTTWRPSSGEGTSEPDQPVRRPERGTTPRAGGK